MRDELLDLLKKIRLPAAFVLGAVLLYSGGVKLADLEGFARIIDNYEMLPGWAVNIAAVMVAAMEAVTGAALVVGLGMRQAAAVVAGVIFLMFGVLACVAVARGLDTACGCFSTDPHSARVGWMTVGRNFFLMIAAVCIVVGEGVGDETQKGEDKGDAGDAAGSGGVTPS
jgi:uncharacterized membrane protein YphA (DoxX/SURF4 family)